MNPQINLLHLKFFCDAVVYRSISEAAKMNYVTQSAVSQAIIKLEKALGAAILIHTRQKFQLTEEGKIVFEQARHVFKTVQNIHERIHQNKETLKGTLKFASTYSLGMSFLAPLYKKMKETFPDIQLSYRLGGLNFIRNSLRQQEAEFAIVVYDQDFSQFTKCPLQQGRFHLYQSIHAPHHLIEQGIFVDYLEGTYVEDLKQHLLQSDEASPLTIQAELSGWEVVARFTEMKMGIGFFPDYLVANDRYPTLKVYPLQLPIFDYQICVIYNKGEKLSRAAQAFLDLFHLDLG